MRYQRSKARTLVQEIKICLPLIMLSFGLGQTTIAVVDFSGYGISQTEVFALTNRLRNELHRTGVFSVIERELMEEILVEQSFQQSGCTSNECLVEIGRLVNVNQIVGGSYSKIGDVFTVSARIVDVETGRVVKVYDFDYEGDISELLTTGMYKVARELSGLEAESKINIFTKLSLLAKIFQWKNPTAMDSVPENGGLSSLEIEFRDVPVGVINEFGTQLRSGPGTEFGILRNLYRDDAIILHNKYDANWWEVNYYGEKGFVYVDHVVIDSSKSASDYLGWLDYHINKGEIEDCFDCEFEYDYELNNYLQINVGENTEIIIKLIRASDDRCIRVAYIPSRNSYKFEAIPEDIYFLKIHYGTDLRKKTYDDHCEYKFIANRFYEETKDDFNFKKTKQSIDNTAGMFYKTFELPVFEIYLNTQQFR